MNSFVVLATAVLSAAGLAAHAPYDAVDVILVTHWHEDHFAADRLRGLTPSPDESATAAVGGLKIHALRIRHNPVRRTPEEHIGFLVDLSR